MEKLTEKELKAQEVYANKLDIALRKTKKPLIVGIVGLIGSGKSTIAKELASLIGATVVSGDDIRICLRKEKEKYDNTRLIAENIAEAKIGMGGNVIIDSDFIDQKKRVSLKEKAKKVGAKVIFIRTYADLDVVIGRIMDADYENIPEDFFGGASSSYQGKNKGAVVKEREMICRILS
ncbi:MAG: AAA family ATPase, partial [Patescibacteria group bacterium]